MVTDEVIKEIYKKYTKPPKSRSELQLDYFMKILKNHHNLSEDDMEIVIDDLEEMNPFHRFLKRSIYGVLEFDTVIAFVFRSHILFFGKEDKLLRVHIKPDKPKSIFSKIFGN